MKFFEGFNKDIKKIAVGSAIIATSLTPMKSNAQENSLSANLNKTVVNKEKISTTSTNPEFYRNEYLKYMEHPSYKERLAKEMYGDLLITEEQQKNVDREYLERINQIKTVPVEAVTNIRDSHFNQKENKVYSIPFAFSHEFSHSLDFRLRPPVLTETSKNYFEFKQDLVVENGFNNSKRIFINIDKIDTDLLELEKQKNDSSTREGYNTNMAKFVEILNEYLDKNKEKIEFNEDKIPKNDNLKPFNYIKNQLNELNGKYFNLQKFYKYFDYKDIFTIKGECSEIILKLVLYEKKQREYDDKIFELKSILEYYSVNTEIKARLNHLRLRAKNEFNYDLNDEFNINKYEKLKDDSQYQDLKEQLNLTDEQINELMKDTAMNESDNDTYQHPGWDYNNNQA